jgi:hypothetical protein
LGGAFFDESVSDFILPQLEVRRLQYAAEKSRAVAGLETAARTTTGIDSIDGIDGMQSHGSGAGPTWLSKTQFHSKLAEKYKLSTTNLTPNTVDASDNINKNKDKAFPFHVNAICQYTYIML